ncbi:MAG: division/cell wall cluster transcriptional repressor MraZ, partial [Desulfobulbaceae bacterium]|nr:division/cell wall cluster transcriptional repressor MraZ [Desulfobulbaceae bacterium]
ECQSDKNGRILLPVHLRNQLNLDKEIIINGMLTFFEVWSKETWEIESMVTDQDFIDFDRTFNDLGMF